MSTNAEIRSLPRATEKALLPAADESSTVSVTLAVEGGIARGHLRWAESCRLVVLEYERSQKLIHRKPDYGAAALLGFTGIPTGLAGYALLASRDKFSDQVVCDEHGDGSIDCSSPRATATGWGVYLAGYAIAATTVAVTTVAMPSSTKVETRWGPTILRVLADPVPCGDGPVAWVGVALYRGYAHVASSRTDRDGNLAFRVPASLTGPVVVAADSGPTGYGLITPNQRFGEVVLRQ